MVQFLAVIVHLDTRDMESHEEDVLEEERAGLQPSPPSTMESRVAQYWLDREIQVQAKM